MNETLTKDRIAEIVGKLSAEHVVEILESDATPRELVEAKLLAQQQERPYTPKPGVRTEVVHQLYDILRADMIDPAER